ncbi:MAG: reverse transcriptase domain-containing protein [Firmicutes bacterium]|nr:reverse transcriptase domain-containing protein [Bacillota bacterium]
MRNPVQVLKTLENHACNPGYVYQRLYRNLYNPEFYLLAYRNIAASQGSMTAGADGMTLDGMSMERINKLIASLKDHSYRPNPARREYIAKRSNPAKKRPLGIPSTHDKLVQEIVRMIFEAIYEPTFSPRSHGFRPKRSCHTALLDIQGNFTGVRWFIEGDIKACFDSFDHHVLISILRRRIHDEHFIALMWKLLRAGYMEQWTYHDTYSGTPQGSGCSPVLANIYLSELDAFVEEYRQDFEKNPKGARKIDSAYLKAKWQYDKRKKALTQQSGNPDAARAFKATQKIMLSRQQHPALEADFTRIQYNRYADDFLVGVIGSKEDALQMKEALRRFLRDRLCLTLSEEKTKVTHSSDFVRYLGYDITVSRDQSVARDRRGTLKRSHYGRVKLYLPHDKWVGKLQEYGALKISKDKDGTERWKAMHRGPLMNKPEISILSKFNAEIRGIYNYYRLANNVSVLDKFYFIMTGSLFKTFAAKANSSMKKIIKKHTVDGVFGVYYDTKAGRKRCELYHDGFVRLRVAGLASVDILPGARKYPPVNSLANRLRAGKCELCGIKTEDILIRHVKALKNLTGKTSGELLMMQKRRKSLALCPDCFQQEHA